jgi:hypothetical protein
MENIEPIEKRLCNPRYIQYCRVNGESDPDRMLERDREEWPGGCMCGFSLWISRKWREWYASLGPCNGQYACLISGHMDRLHQDHAAFDKWLEKEVT